ncbi:hypothetical protein F4810DRAFT_716065 [Camillea tinctor]|nr:hypothetical protein F4810DRAFT_716065 [Camillea tinctor]
MPTWSNKTTWLLDTVLPHIPFSVEGDVVRGRSACDGLGLMAAQIFAVEELHAEGRLYGVLAVNACGNTTNKQIHFFKSRDVEAVGFVTVK